MPWWFVLRLSICFLNTVVQKSLQMNFMISNSSLNLAVSFVNLKRSTARKFSNPTCSPFYQSLSHSKPHVFQLSNTSSVFHLPLLRGLVHSRHHLVMEKQKQRLIRHFLLILPSSEFWLPLELVWGFRLAPWATWPAPRLCQAAILSLWLRDRGIHTASQRLVLKWVWYWRQPTLRGYQVLGAERKFDTSSNPS